MDSATNLEAFLKRDRWFVLAGLAGVTALAWAYLVVMAGDMDAMAMPAVEPWSAVDFWLMFVMWAVMMVGMILWFLRAAVRFAIDSGDKGWRCFFVLEIPNSLSRL